jgi:hypothetical protein
MSRSQEHNASVGKIISLPRRSVVLAVPATTSALPAQIRHFLDVGHRQRQTRPTCTVANGSITSPATTPTYWIFVHCRRLHHVYTRKKINAIRNKTADAPPPDIQPHSSLCLSSFLPVTPAEIKSILAKRPTKSSLLDLLPTWLLVCLISLYNCYAICVISHCRLESFRRVKNNLGSFLYSKAYSRP